MKRVLILSLTIILCVSFIGCVKNKDNSSISKSTLVSGISGTANSISGVSSSKITNSGKSDTEELIKQLDDLEKALKDLDQLSEGDIEIPTP